MLDVAITAGSCIIFSSFIPKDTPNSKAMKINNKTIGKAIPFFSGDTVTIEVYIFSFFADSFIAIVGDSNTLFFLDYSFVRCSTSIF